MLLGAAKNAPGLMVLRFILGMLEVCISISEFRCLCWQRLSLTLIRHHCFRRVVL